jgi:FkbM family methyltransferase
MTTWSPPSSFEEKLKHLLVPPSLYIRSLYKRELKKGERELHLIPRLAQKGKVSLDIGANKGVYSYALLPHSASVHAFEPNPKSRGILKSWSAGRVTIHDIALSDKAGEATLFIPRGGKSGYSNQGSSLQKLHLDREHGEIVIRTARLDDLGIKDIGFIKIDVEGFEQQVLEGARETLKRDRPNLLVEIEEKHAKAPIEQEIARVCAYGYDCFVLLDGTLSPFKDMDAEKRHRNPASRADYVFNFIFLPENAGLSGISG